MNPEISDSYIKDEKHIEVKKTEPREFTKEDLIKLKEKIKNGIEETEVCMFLGDITERYINGSDDDRQEILNLFREDFSEEEYSKMFEYLEMRRKLVRRGK